MQNNHKLFDASRTPDKKRWCSSSSSSVVYKRDFHRLKLVTDKFVQRKWEGGGQFNKIFWLGLLVKCTAVEETWFLEGFTVFVLNSFELLVFAALSVRCHVSAE